MDLVNEQANKHVNRSVRPVVQSCSCLHCNPVILQILTGGAGLKIRLSLIC